MKKRILNINTLLIAAVLITGLIFFAIQTSKKEEGSVAYVYVNDEKQQEIDLSKDGTYHIDGGRLPVTLNVKDGAISFINSVCPDHICEGYGYIHNVDEKAVCLPARVYIIIN
jgi:hypothetical protein